MTPSRTVRRLRSPVTRHLLPGLLIGLTVEAGLRVTSLPRLAHLLGITVQTRPQHRAYPVSPALLGSSDAARYRAARHVLWLWPEGGRSSCLRLALVAGFLLRRRGPQLHLGVTRVAGQACAHAWISVDGMIFDPLAGAQQPLTDLPEPDCAN